MALRGAVCNVLFIVVDPLDSDLLLGGRCIMAAAAAFEIKVEKILEERKSCCLLGVDRHGRRQKIVLYPPACVVLHAKLVAGVVYRFDPAPSKKGNSAFLSYSAAIPIVTSSDGAGFPAYPSPIGVGQIDATMTETYQDIRVTVSHDLGARQHDTKRGQVVCRSLLCAGPGDQKFELVLWGDKAGSDAFKKGVTVVFYDVWIRKITNDQRFADRMELSGSLSAFGYSNLTTLMDDVVRAFTEAKSPARKRLLSDLAGLALSPGGDEAQLRVQLARLSESSSTTDTVSDDGDVAPFKIGSLDCDGDAGALRDLVTFLAARYDGKVEEWDPRLQTLLLQGSCARIQKEVTTALSSLVNIFCRVAIHATQLKTLRTAREQQRLAEAAEAKFVAAVTSLRLEHAYTWQALIDLGDFLEEKYKKTYVLWVEFAKVKIQGPHGVLPADPQELIRAFFESVQDIAG